MGVCNLLGIYPDSIESVGEYCEGICDNFDVDVDGFWSSVMARFAEEYGENLGNGAIECMFLELENAIGASFESRGVEPPEFDYYINGGLDSNFYVGEYDGNDLTLDEFVEKHGREE